MQLQNVAELDGSNGFVHWCTLSVWISLNETAGCCLFMLPHCSVTYSCGSGGGPAVLNEVLLKSLLYMSTSHYA